jgi:hypothetical protein
MSEDYGEKGGKVLKMRNHMSDGRVTYKHCVDGICPFDVHLGKQRSCVKPASKSREHGRVDFRSQFARNCEHSSSMRTKKR